MSDSCPLLTIAVPTWNRCEYLRELLPVLLTQAEAADAIAAGRVEVLVSDNGSTDGTAQYLAEATRTCGLLRVRRNSSNLGYSRNYRACHQEARGKYLWVVGDDDVLLQDAVVRVIEVLAARTPAVVILMDALRVVGRSQPVGGGPAPSLVEHETYAGLLRSCTGSLRPLVIAHTWIPSVVYERNRLDVDQYDRADHTYFAPSYALARGLMSGGKALILPDQLVGLRAKRAPHFHHGIPRQQAHYLVVLGWWFKNWRIAMEGLLAYPRAAASGARVWIRQKLSASADRGS